LERICHSRTGSCLAAVVAPLFAVSLLSGTATAELITNGSFEIATATITSNLAGAGLANWNDSPGTSEALVFPSWYTNGYLFPPNVSLAGLWPQFSPDGGNFVFSDGNFFPAPISQTVGGLTPGHTYNLSFYQGLDQDTEPNVTVPGPVTGQWTVTFGTDVQTAPGMSANGATGAFSPWAQENMSFVASGTSEVLSFFAIGTGDPPLLMLDGVHMLDAADNPDGTAPEPAGIWLTALGGALLAWKATTRRRA
jgi:hypothetical protein